MMEDIAKILAKDAREKKRAGVGIFSRKATRKGSTNSALRTPYGMLRGKALKEYTAPGKLNIYNIRSVGGTVVMDPYRDRKETRRSLDDILDGLGYADLVNLSRNTPEKGLEILMELAANYSYPDAAEKLGISTCTIGSLCRSMGIYKTRTGQVLTKEEFEEHSRKIEGAKKLVKEALNNINVPIKENIPPDDEEEKHITDVENNTQTEPPKKLSTKFSFVYDTEEFKESIINTLEGVIKLMEPGTDTSKIYKISLVLEERA